MYISVYDFINLMMDDCVDIEIWDIKSEDTVFEGTARDAMHSEYASYDVCSFDLPDPYNSNSIFTINIETE